MQFRVGQIVRLRLNGKLCRGYGAPRGAKATVTKANHIGFCYRDSLSVIWVRISPIKHRQEDGAYFASDFELVAEPDGQMLFDFMYESVTENS